MKHNFTNAILKPCIFTFLFLNILSGSDKIFAQTNVFSAVTNVNSTAVCPSGTKPQVTISTNNAAFAVGKKVLIIQMMGASVNTTPAPEPPTDAADLVFGSISNYGNAGHYEYNYVFANSGAPGYSGAATITFQNILSNTYDVVGKVQIVSVPEYPSLTISTPLTGAKWNGSTGGVLTFDVIGKLTLASTISMDTMGFRGGPLSYRQGPLCDNSNGIYTRPDLVAGTAYRGYGIADFGLNTVGRGAYANAGGGGAGHNSGGGGGGNGGSGGKGGWEFASCFPNFTSTATGRVAYSSDGFYPVGSLQRRHGLPGYNLNPIISPTLNKIFLGGGGGTGNDDNATATAGAPGGGIIIISAGEVAGTSGTISANGLTAAKAGNDGAGGGGAGGSIFLNVPYYSIASLTVSAKGGGGGDNGTQGSCHGTGGGGGGGLIWTSGASVPSNIIRNADGGAAGLSAPGTTDDCAFAYGGTWGSTPGNAGLVKNNLIVNVSGCCSKADLGSNQTLCSTLTLNNGTASNTNKVFTWYKDGVVISGATGPTYTVTVAGTYKVVVDSVVSGVTFCTTQSSVTVSAGSMPPPDLGPAQTICSPAYVTLSPFNLGSFPSGTTWQWAKDGVTITGAQTANLSNVKAVGTYTLTASVPGCPPISPGSVTVTSAAPVVADKCIPVSGSMTLSASGGMGGPYSWYTAQTGGTAITTGGNYTVGANGSSLTVNPLNSTTTYYVKDNGLKTKILGPLEATIATLATFAQQNPTAAGGTPSPNPALEEYFTVYKNFNLISVKVNTAGAGTGKTVSVTILNSTGGIVGTQSLPGVNTTANGFTKVTFTTPIALSAGQTYSITAGGIGSTVTGTGVNCTIRTLANATGNASAVYPYSPYNDPQVGKILEFTKTGASSTNYACFYDYEVSYSLNCDRVPVLAEVGGSCAIPTPVRLLYFYAEKTKNDINLSWETASEFNNDYFLIQRSYDGINYETIAKTKGKGNSNSASFYHYTDEDVNGGTVYYKLLQTDFDGKEKEVGFTSVLNEKGFTASVYPNPFTGKFELVLAGNKGNFSAKIHDLSGRILFSGEKFSAGEKIELGDDLAPGSYLLEVRSDYEVKVIKLVKQ